MFTILFLEHQNNDIKYENNDIPIVSLIFHIGQHVNTNYYYYEKTIEGWKHNVKLLAINMSKCN